MKIVGIMWVAVTLVSGAKQRKLSFAPIRGLEYEFLDLTHPFDDTTLGWPGLTPFEMEITNYKVTDAGYWLQTEDYNAATHVGTHMDAPCHIVKEQWTLEDIPLYRFFAPAAVVDISERAGEDRDTNLELQDLIVWEKKTNHSLDGTVVLVNTGWGKKYPNKEEYLGTDTDDETKIHCPGISPMTAEWVARNRNIYGLGIDTTSLDNGQAVHRKAHEALFRANIYGLENVANVHRLPEFGAYVYVFPMRINGACGAPTRIIAIVPKRRKKRLF